MIVSNELRWDSAIHIHLRDNHYCAHFTDGKTEVSTFPSLAQVKPLKSAEVDVRPSFLNIRSPSAPSSARLHHGQLRVYPPAQSISAIPLPVEGTWIGLGSSSSLPGCSHRWVGQIELWASWGPGGSPVGDEELSGSLS